MNRQELVVAIRKASLSNTAGIEIQLAIQKFAETNTLGEVKEVLGMTLDQLESSVLAGK